MTREEAKAKVKAQKLKELGEELRSYEVELFPSNKLKSKSTGSSTSKRQTRELVGPVRSKHDIRQAYGKIQDEKIKKKVEGKRTIKNGFGSSHGF